MRRGGGDNSEEVSLKSLMLKQRRQLCEIGEEAR